MKRKLAKAVVVGLMCASVLPGGTAGAVTNNITINDQTAEYNFSDTLYQIADAGSNGHVIHIEGSNDKKINFNDNTAIGCYYDNTTGIYNESSGLVNVKGSLVVYGDYHNSQVAIVNKGKINFDDNIDVFNIPIQNSGEMNFNGYLYFDNVSVNEADVQDNPIVNTGTMKINGYFDIDARVFEENNDYIGSGGYKTAIDNSGILEINGNGNNGSRIIVGNVIHREGAKTQVVLNGYNVNDDAYHSALLGNIIGSDENFSLKLEECAIWAPLKQEGAVEGIELNGGDIHINQQNYLYGGDDKPAYSWNDDFDTLTLKNFKSNGNGVISLSTDLANDVGDSVNFVGTTPDVTLGLFIQNKDDNNGTPIKREDGHSVTVVTAPSDSLLKFDSLLGFYNTLNTAYSPIIDEVISDNSKRWNFVGWEESGSKNPTEQNEDGHEINGEDIDNVFRRLNDIRTDPSEVGVWIRGEKGDTQIRNYKYEYNLMSGGYDWHNENDARKLFYGFGVSYATNECDDGVVGDTKSMGYNLYGSWLGKKNNDYVDVILKYGTLDKDYAGIDNNGVLVKGSYDKNLFAIAAKYGRRIFVDDSFYYEPQIGYTYGRVGSADYVDNWDTHIHADASNSHIASLGVQVGKNIKGTEVYGKLAYVYDFDGNIHVRAPGISADDDMGGGYMQVAIGASRKVDKDNSFYIDVEKDFGNKVKKPYAFSIGYRHTF